MDEISMGEVTDHIQSLRGQDKPRQDKNKQFFLSSSLRRMYVQNINPPK